MKEKIRSITDKGKTTKNEWTSDDSDFLRGLCSVYEKLGQLFFNTYSLTCLKKDTPGLSKVINISTSL